MINIHMNPDLINQWFAEEVLKSAKQWAICTFRADGTVRNAAAVKQTPWSTSASHAAERVIKALEWTVTELRRGHKKDLRFVSWIGGDESLGVKSHIHSAVELPDGDLEMFRQRMEFLWQRNLEKTLKANVKGSVWMDYLGEATKYASYCARQEDRTLIRGSDKVLVNRSFSL